MARSEITIASLTAYDTAGTVTEDAVDTTNNHFVDISGYRDEKLLIRLYGGTGDGFTAAFKAGDFPAGALGDESVAVAATAVKMPLPARIRKGTIRPPHQQLPASPGDAIPGRQVRW